MSALMKSMFHLAASVSIQPCFIVNYSGLKELFKGMLVNCFKVSKTRIFIIIL